MVVFALAADAVYTLATAPNLNWNQVWTWLFRPFILGGIVVTIELTVLAMVIGIVLGVVLAVMRLSPNPVMSWVSWLYIWFFRGTPVLVQIFFWYNLNAVLPHVGLIIPGTDLGLVMRRIVLPQAMRVIIPPTGNETISMLKTTSLAVIAAVPELFTRSQQVSNVYFTVIEMAIVASIWYLVMTSILTAGQYYIERYYARGAQRELPPTPFQRFRQLLFTFHAAPATPGRR